MENYSTSFDEIEPDTIIEFFIKHSQNLSISNSIFENYNDYLNLRELKKENITIVYGKLHFSSSFTFFR